MNIESSGPAVPRRAPSAPPARRLTHLSAWLNRLGLSWPVLIFFAFLAIGPLLTSDQYILRLFVISLMFGVLAMVFDFTGGYINAVNFGFAAFSGLGAYTSALVVLRLGASTWMGLVAAFVAAGLLGFVTGVLTLPLRGIYISLMAWFVGLTLMSVTAAMVDVTRGQQGLIVPPLFEGVTVTSTYYILLAIAIIMYLGLRLIINSYIGLAFRAIGQNFEAARASGINPTRYKLINFTLSCACAGLIGGYYGHFVGILTPDVMDTGRTMEVMALSYMGGSGSLIGGWLAAFLVIPAFDYLRSLMEIRLIIYGLSLVAIMILYPAGLVGLLRAATARVRAYRERRARTALAPES
ncbi:MAG: branched-chain amino acid ABC transporter permease [Anaerolineae bacterium]|nr:branched-chain amino acid ABC transporter permease [Anaerolineae bacterium]